MSVELPTISLHRTVVKSIRRHAQEQAAKGGYEAVGYVAKQPDEEKATATVPLHNHAFNPGEAFFVEPYEQFKAEQKLAEAGYEIVGVYHSHVNSEALPSMSDHAMARPGRFAFIYSVVFDELKAYWEVDGNLEPVEMI